MTNRASAAPASTPGPTRLPTTETNILNAAEELFCLSGYNGVSARDVAKRANATKALVFYHFGSMRGLFEAVLGRYYVAHHAGLAEALVGAGDVRTRMHRLVDAYLDFMATHVRYATLVQGQLAHPDSYALVQKSFEPLYRFIESTLLEVAPHEGKAAARQLFVTFSGAVINWFTYAPMLGHVFGGDLLSNPLLQERREHIRWLVDLVLTGLQVAEASAEHLSLHQKAR